MTQIPLNAIPDSPHVNGDQILPIPALAYQPSATKRGAKPSQAKALVAVAVLESNRCILASSVGILLWFQPTSRKGKTGETGWDCSLT